MKLKVVWSDFAEKQLDEIYEYYLTQISAITAKKIAQSILSQTEVLKDNPYLGQKENLLINRKIEYRYLVYTNYKIIYSIDEQNDLVKIADIFDSRQNPVKITRRK